MIEANANLYEIILKVESQKINGKSLPTSAPKNIPSIENGILTSTAMDKVRGKGDNVAASSVEGAVDVSTGSKTKPRGREPNTTATTITKTVAARRRPNQKVVDRRRRRGQRLSSGSSCSEEEGERERVDCGSSDSSLSMLSDRESEEDIQVLESLSESSTSEDELLPKNVISEQADKQTLTNQPCRLEAETTAAKNTSSNPSIVDSRKPRAPGRRHIVLAASFNLAPSSGNPPQRGSDDSTMVSRVSTDAPGAEVATVGDGDRDQMLKKVYGEAVSWSCKHTACSILAEDSYLVPIRVFSDWLHTYSIVIASSSKQVGIGPSPSPPPPLPASHCCTLKSAR